MARKKTVKPVDVEYVDVEQETLDAFQEVDKAKDQEQEHEILTGVVLTKCRVVSYNPFSNIVVYERDGQLIQTNAIQYDGSGYVEVE